MLAGKMCVLCLAWRGGRVAEGGGLLNRYTDNTVSRVRIPPSPPGEYVEKKHHAFVQGTVAVRSNMRGRGSRR